MKLILFIIIAFSYNVIVYRSNINILIMFIVFLYFMYLYEFKERFNNKDFMNEDDIILEHSENFINKD